MNNDNKPAKAIVFGAAFLALIGAVALFGFRILKTERGREDVTVLLGGGETQQEKDLRENRDMAIKAAIRNGKVAEAYEKCGIEISRTPSFAQPIGSDDDRSFSAQNVACLKSQGITRVVGAKIAGSLY